MKKFSHNLVHLQSFFLFYLIPLVILIIFFMFYNNDILLCDDNGWHLSGLKISLTIDVGNYRTSLVQYEMYSDLYNQYTGRPVRDYAEEETVSQLANAAHQRMNESLANARYYENQIRAIQPWFRSPITQVNFPRIGR